MYTTIDVQNEQHVFLGCAKTESKPSEFGVDGNASNLGKLMGGMNVQKLVSFVHGCLKYFK